MKKNIIRGILVQVVLLVVYCLIVFLCPFERNGVFWVSFAFALIAFAVAAAAVYKAFLKNTDAKSRFYGFPIARIGVIYLAIQMIAGIVFMALAAWAPLWLAVVVYAVLLGVACIGLISADAVADEVTEMDVRLKENTSLMRDLQTTVAQMTSLSADAGLKKLADELRYSDPVSSAALSEVEQTLAAVVAELRQAVTAGDAEAISALTAKASATLSERNRLCKLNKN